MIYPIEVAFSPMPKIDFMRRFTPTEWIGIDNATVTDPMIRYIMRLYDAADTVRLDHADTTAALAYFVYQGLLTQVRADEILTP